MSRSLTITSIIIALFGFFLDKLGINVGSDEITTFVTLAMQLGGMLMAWYGRYRMPSAPVSLFGKRLEY